MKRKSISVIFVCHSLNKRMIAEKAKKTKKNEFHQISFVVVSVLKEMNEDEVMPAHQANRAKPRRRVLRPMPTNSVMQYNRGKRQWLHRQIALDSNGIK